MLGVIFEITASTESVLNMLIAVVVVINGLPCNPAQRNSPGLNVCIEKARTVEQKIGQRKWLICQVGVTVV